MRIWEKGRKGRWLVACPDLGGNAGKTIGDFTLPSVKNENTRFNRVRKFTVWRQYGNILSLNKLMEIVMPLNSGH